MKDIWPLAINCSLDESSINNIYAGNGKTLFLNLFTELQKVEKARLMEFFWYFIKL